VFVAVLCNWYARNALHDEEGMTVGSRAGVEDFGDCGVLVSAGVDEDDIRTEDFAGY
jgi:hypothetical protein